MMIPSRIPVLSRCWRLLKALMPQRLRARLRNPWKTALKRLQRRPAAVRPDELSLQLDAILRELRRLHVRLEELNEGLDGRELLERPADRDQEHEAA